MLHRRIFPALFLLIVCSTCWLVVKQCGAGRVSEAFSDVEAGIRDNISAQENVLESGFWRLEKQVNSYPNPLNVHYLTGFQQLQIRHRSYHRFLDSLRVQIAAAAGVPLDSFIVSHTLTSDHPSVKKLLLAGKPNLLMQITARTDSLRSDMLALADRARHLEHLFHQIFHTNTKIYYPFNGRTGNFNDLPVTGLLAMISHLQATALTSMIGVLNYCIGQTGGSGGWGNWITPAVSARSSYVLNGDYYQADIYLAGYSQQIDERSLKFFINKKPIAIKDGIGHFEKVGYGVGTRTFLVEARGNIWREDKGGKPYLDTFRVSREFSYQVIPFFPKVNLSDRLSYLYAYVENPVSVSAVGLNGSGEMRVSAPNARLQNVGGGRYMLTPHSLAPVTLETGSIVKFKYPVRLLPDPVPALGEFHSGSINREKLSAQTALSARFPDDFDFKVDCKILNFHLTRFRSREDPEVVENQGEQFNSSVRELLKTTQSGDRLLFDEIQVQCGAEPTPRTVAGLSLRVE